MVPCALITDCDDIWIQSAVGQLNMLQQSESVFVFNTSVDVFVTRLVLSMCWLDCRMNWASWIHS